MNYDQTREPLEPDNLALNIGIVGGWASYVKSHPNQVTPIDCQYEPYVRRLYALTRDMACGTPGANGSLYTCDVPDTELADKLKQYLPALMRNYSARDRRVPDALPKVIQYFQKYQGTV